MGQEIFYCFRCQIRITGAEIAKGTAVQTAGRVSCGACIPYLPELPPKAVKPATLRRSDSPRSGSRVVPTAPPPSKLPLVLGAGAVAALALVVVLASAGGRRPPPPVPAAAPRPKPAPVVVGREEQIAREAALMDVELRGPMDRDDFKQALAFLEAARTRRSEPAWEQAVEERLRRVEAAAQQAFGPLRDKAVAAARGGDVAEAKAIRERVASWGLPKPAAELEAALAEAPKPFQQGPDGLVVIEAEHYAAKLDRDGLAWTPQTRDGVAAMQGLPDRGASFFTDYAARAPQLDFPVHFTRAGTHYLWIRGLATNDKANSVHVGLGGAAEPGGTALSLPASSKWVWTRAGAKKTGRLEIPSPGLHVINLWLREDGVYVDRLLLTPDESYKPESPR